MALGSPATSQEEDAIALIKLCLYKKFHNPDSNCVAIVAVEEEVCLICDYSNILIVRKKELFHSLPDESSFRLAERDLQMPRTRFDGRYSQPLNVSESSGDSSQKTTR